MSVKISIETKQFDEAGNMDTIEVVSYGKLFRKNGKIYLTYNEKVENAEISNTVKISEKDGEVMIKKTGAVNSTMKLVYNQKHTDRYNLPMGAFLIDTYVRSMEIKEIEENSMDVFIDYDLEIVNIFKGRNKLKIEVRPCL